MMDFACLYRLLLLFFFVFKQNTAYEMRISDWSSDVCSSDLDRYVDRMLFGWEVPASMFQSINAIYIILLAPLFAWLWTTLGRRGLEPSAPAKFGLGMIQQIGRA